jgi:DNA-binding IscR family transcriptional regulator
MQGTNHLWSQLQTTYTNTLRNRHLKDLLNDEERNISLVSQFEDLIFDFTH